MNLVGRDREIGLLDDAWRRARAGVRAVVAITGEPGIGKSRILDELAARIVATGGTVAWGRTTEVGLTAAFWPWLQVMSALDDEIDRAPRLGDDAPHATARLALFDAVTAFLIKRAMAAPFAIILDDFHAADLSSLQLLELVVPRLAGRGVLVAIAARDTDASPAVAAVLGRIQRNAERIVLGRLAQADVEQLVGARADAARVFELSAGNPLFVEELVAAVGGTGEMRLPALSSVREVIRDRVGRLPEAARGILVAAAVVGRDFRGAVVAEMLDDGARDIGSLVAPALRLGMVAMTTPDRYRFSHALVAEAIADELDPSERARLHLRAAQAIEKRDRGEASAIAHHLLAAGHLAAEAAVAAAERAAAEAMAKLAFEDAASLLDRAVAALGLAAPGDERRRAQLVCARAEALHYAGQHAHANAALEDALPSARRIGDSELFARIALARGLQWQFGVVDPILVALLEEARVRLGDGEGALRARVLARLAAASQPAIDPMRPVAHAREAIARAGSLATRDRLDVMYTATGALVDYMPPGELQAIHSEVLDLARAEGQRLVVVHTHLRMCFAAMESLDREAFEESVHAHRSVAVALGLPRWMRPVHMLDAMRFALDGDFAQSKREFAVADALAHDVGDHNAIVLGIIHTAFVAWAQTAPVVGTLDELVNMAGAGRNAILAWIAAMRGEAEAARSYMAMVNVARDVNLLSMVGEAAMLVGDPEDAAAYYDALAPRTGTIVLGSMVGFCVQDLFDRMLLGLAAKCGRWDVVDTHGQRALEIAISLASPPWAARVRADWADALHLRDGDGDRDRARQLWSDALAEAERMTMPGLVAQCRAGLGADVAGPRVFAPRAAAPGKALVTLTKQGALWTIRGFGDEVHVRDSRGLHMLARLVDDSGRELHALDLSGAIDGVVDGGDAGEVLDATARATYRARLGELMAAREQAEAWNDAGRAERANDEIEALSTELERAIGLGGRARRTGGAGERARSNVQRRIQHAVQQIRSASRAIGDHLAASVKTGTFCIYEP